MYAYKSIGKTSIMQGNTIKRLSIGGGIILMILLIAFFVYERKPHAKTIAADIQRDHPQISISDQCDTNQLKSKLRDLTCDFTMCYALQEYGEFFKWINVGNTIFLTSTLNNLMEIELPKSGIQDSVNNKDAKSVPWNPKWNNVQNKCFQKKLCAALVTESKSEWRSNLYYRISYEVGPLQLKPNFLTPANVLPSALQAGKSVLYYRNWDDKDKRHVWILITENVRVHGMYDVTMFNVIVSMKNKEYKNKTMKYMLAGALELFAPSVTPSGYPYNTVPKIGMVSVRTDKPYTVAEARGSVRHLNLPVRFSIVQDTFSCKLLGTPSDDVEGDTYLNVFMLAESTIDVRVTDKIELPDCEFALYGLKINNIKSRPESDSISIMGGGQSRRSIENHKNLHYYDVESEMESESDFEKDVPMPLTKPDNETKVPSDQVTTENKFGNVKPGETIKDKNTDGGAQTVTVPVVDVKSSETGSTA